MPMSYTGEPRTGHTTPGVLSPDVVPPVLSRGEESPPLMSTVVGWGHLKTMQFKPL